MPQQTAERKLRLSKSSHIKDCSAEIENDKNGSDTPKSHKSHGSIGSQNSAPSGDSHNSHDSNKNKSKRKQTVRECGFYQNKFNPTKEDNNIIKQLQNKDKIFPEQNWYISSRCPQSFDVVQSTNAKSYLKRSNSIPEISPVSFHGYLKYCKQVQSRSTKTINDEKTNNNNDTTENNKKLIFCQIAMNINQIIIITIVKIVMIKRKILRN